MKYYTKKGFTRTSTLVSLLVFLSNLCSMVIFQIKNHFFQIKLFRNKNTRPKLVSGFTLIELLVVIAIIGILSAVVLASLNTARAKGANAAVKSNLHGIRNQSEIFYDNNSQVYTNVCDDPNVTAAINAAIVAGGDVGATVATRCNSSANAWAANALLKIPEGANLYWCVDNTGNTKGEPTELGGAFVCS